MEVKLLLAFLAASALLTLMPGPDILLVVTESITRGKEKGIALSLGLCSGVLVHTLAAATGLSLIIQNSATAFQVLKYLGALYLFYLAWLALKEKPQRVDEKLASKDTEATLVKRGFIMNVLNPKVSLFFIAFLPQFVGPSGMNITLQMVILGFIFMIQALLIFSVVSILAGRLSSYLNNDRFWKGTSYAKAAVLFVLGLSLVFCRP